MATEYANLCTYVVAPSRSIADLLVKRCVTTPIRVIPTGIDLERFGGGNGEAFRREYNISPGALVVGHVGRLGGEKNLDYLARAVGRFLAERQDAVCVVIGTGDQEGTIQEIVSQIADSDRILMPGSKTGQALIDAYAAMDVFVFSSQSETQGMVLAEAMAARTPVLALDGPGVRDVVHESNGRLLSADASKETFVAALAELTGDRQFLQELGESARKSVQDYDLATCAERMLALYEELREQTTHARAIDPAPWDRLLRRLEIEWNLLIEKTSALSAAVLPTDVMRSQLD